MVTMTKRRRDLDSSWTRMMRSPQEAPTDEKGIKARNGAARSLLLRVHRNMGHPANTNLTKLRRDARATVGIVGMAKGLGCDVCQSSLKAKARLPAATHEAQPGQVIAVDGFPPDHEPRKAQPRCLLTIGEATRLLRAVCLEEKWQDRQY